MNSATSIIRRGGLLLTATFGALLWVTIPAGAQATEGLAGIDWEYGPSHVTVGNHATVDVPDGFVFTQKSGARRFLELTQNPPSGRELGILAPENLKWFVIFSFDDIGYVKDDEKDSLDAAAMLASIQRATEKANEERRRRAWSTITVVGWIDPPHYDATTHNLEWSLEGRDEGGELVANHFTRFLGRRGVMAVKFVGGIDAMNADIPAFRQVMRGFAFTPDNSYRAFVAGDKVAEYGLTGLIIGGAAAAATKTGLVKYIWKLMVAAIAGLAALLKGLAALLKKFFSPSQRRPEAGGYR